MWLTKNCYQLTIVIRWSREWSRPVLLMSQRSVQFILDMWSMVSMREVNTHAQLVVISRNRRDMAMIYLSLLFCSSISFFTHLGRFTTMNLQQGFSNNIISSTNRWFLVVFLCWHFFLGAFSTTHQQNEQHLLAGFHYFFLRQVRIASTCCCCHPYQMEMAMALDFES